MFQKNNILTPANLVPRSDLIVKNKDFNEIYDIFHKLLQIKDLRQAIGENNDKDCIGIIGNISNIVYRLIY